MTTLGAALSTVPGFTVVRTGGPGALTSLFPRGGESDFTLVLVDGIRANAFGGGIDLSQVPLADVERIEVVRGPQSAIFGADAIGGVVQIITRQGGPPTGGAVLETGSRDARRFQASTTGTVRTLRWQAGGEYFDDEGYHRRGAGQRRAVSPTTMRRSDRGGSAAAGAAGVGPTCKAASAMSTPNVARPAPTGRIRPDDSSASIASRAGPPSAVRWECASCTRGPGRPAAFASAWSSTSPTTTSAFSAPSGPLPRRPQRSHGRVQTDAAARCGIGVSGGVEWLGESARSSFITAGRRGGAGRASRDRHIRRRAAGAALERLSVQAGMRAEHITREAFAVESASRERCGDVGQSEGVCVVAGEPVAARRRRSAWTRIRAAAGTGIRPPDAFEIAFTDNPSLKPERSRSVEVGVTQALAAGAIQLDATAFFNEYDDLIVSVGSLRDVSRYRTDNVSNARARGVELGAAWQARHGLGVAGRLHVPRHRDSRGRQLGAGAVAVSCRRRAAAASAPQRIGDAWLDPRARVGVRDARRARRDARCRAGVRAKRRAL